MKYVLIILSVFLTCSLNAQKSDYAKKEYDTKIFLYQIEQVENHNIDKESYLFNSKPFSKWDPRPLNDSLVWLMDELHTASSVPNFFWGAVSDYFEIKIKKALALPNKFLKHAYKEEKSQITYLKENEEMFSELTALLLKSDKKIFFKQGGLERVDDLYKENNEYWKYIIPEDSPFPISDSIITNITNEFSIAEDSILKIIEKLDIYAIYNDSEAIFFLLDGVLDNSYGFIYQKEEFRVKATPLFNLSLLTRIKSQYYFYVAN